jgi:N-acetylmuramoyl-L-alanine amidase
VTDENTSSDDADILARTLIGEARGEGKPGMEDVACVVMNRVAKQTWYGRTAGEVCLKLWQFSCWNRDDPNRQYLLSLDTGSALDLDALAIARKAIAGELPDRTDGATHYRRIGTPASWWKGQAPCFTEGHHEFFNDID